MGLEGFALARDRQAAGGGGERRLEGRWYIAHAAGVTCGMPYVQQAVSIHILGIVYVAD